MHEELMDIHMKQIIEAKRRNHSATTLDDGQKALENLVQELSEKLTNANDELERLTTEYREAEREIRALSYRLLVAHEDEMQWISHELHDALGGAITLLKLTLHRVKSVTNEPAKLMLDEVNGIVDELADQVTMLSTSLRPGILDEYGLAAALESYFEQYTHRANIRVNFGQDGAKKRFPVTIEAAAYRIVQEALTNVARYAGVNEVNVNIECNAEVLRLCIEDHGCGFYPEQISRESSGILGMQDRAYLSGGILTVDSSPKNGTVITCELPL